MSLKELLENQELWSNPCDKLTAEEYNDTAKEVNRLIGYLCVYMYMLYCEADIYSKTQDKDAIEDNMMDPSYIGSKIAYFLRWVQKVWFDTFIGMLTRDVRAWTMYKHTDVGVWAVDYCKQNYPKKLQEFIDKNPELKSMFPDDIRDEHWMLA